VRGGFEKVASNVTYHSHNVDYLDVPVKFLGKHFPEPSLSDEMFDGFVKRLFAAQGLLCLLQDVIN
jgi:hypothetical protein